MLTASQRILRELQAAGVHGEVAARAVAENVEQSVDEMRRHIESLCEKRKLALCRRHGATFIATAQGQAKIASWLIGRGYDDALVWDVVRAAAKTPAE